MLSDRNRNRCFSSDWQSAINTTQSNLYLNGHSSIDTADKMKIEYPCRVEGWLNVCGWFMVIYFKYWSIPLLYILVFSHPTFTFSGIYSLIFNLRITLQCLAIFLILYFFSHAQYFLLIYL